jgi:hypothetical protein
MDAKHERIQGLQALIDTHMAAERPDWIYIAKLETRLRIAKVQLTHMLPIKEQ